ncbi:hypothetical protein [Actinomyces sp.]|uniref:hypothetical protein n=1 Tax=Actinomyces sp. TaxID=29317 RepID=UPI0026DCF333|nr:hypothetical protein [Actinomyces sp.]MDO4655791.1 hypothetical protein [Actinomyces sp.]
MDDWEYADLVCAISECDADLAKTIDRILSKQRRQQELSAIRECSYEEYVQSLPLISPAEIADAIRNGLLVNSEDEHGNMNGIRTDEDVSGAFLYKPIATARIEASTLVSVLSKFCSPSTAEVANPKGVGITQVLIQGTLDLNWINSPFPLRFEGCEFDSSVWADGFSAPALSFDSCNFTNLGYLISSEHGAFNATRMRIKNKLSFFDCINIGQLFLLDCHIGSFIPLSDVFDEEKIGHPCRIVINGTRFDELEISDRSQFELGFGKHLDNVKVGSVDIVVEENDRSDEDSQAKFLLNWLDSRKPSKRRADSDRLSPLVVAEFEDSLHQSGKVGLSRRFGILSAEYQTGFEGVTGFFKQLILGTTVQYFYNNLRAVRILAGVWVIAYVIVVSLSYASGAYSVSPMVSNASIPQAWMSCGYNRFIWALLYSMDLVFSPLSLGQTQVLWPTSSVVALVFATIKGMSLALFALFVTGITGITNRRSK